MQGTLVALLRCTTACTVAAWLAGIAGNIHNGHGRGLQCQTKNVKSHLLITVDDSIFKVYILNHLFLKTRVPSGAIGESRKVVELQLYTIKPR